MKRIKDLYVAIDNVMQENEYYDDETEDTCCDVTEEQVYKMVIERDDFRFLTAEVIKSEIHKFFTDWEYRIKMANI